MFSAGKSNEKKDKDGIVTISTLEKSYAPRPLAGVLQSESTETTSVASLLLGMVQLTMQQQ
jgi:hypothetical protein